MDGFTLAQPVLDLAIDGDVLHRAGPVERDERHDILDTGGLHPPERIHHVRAFHLKDCNGLGGGIEVIGGFVVERDHVDLIYRAIWRGVKIVPIGMDMQMPPLPADQIDGVLNDGQRLQAEEVEFHQPRAFHPFHVELGGGHVRARILIERHQPVERAIPDHHARRMGRGVAQQPLDLLAIGQQAIDDLFGFREFAQARLVSSRPLDRDGLDTLDRDQLRQPVDLTIGHLQHAADVADRGLGEEGTEGDDLPHLVAALFALNMADLLFPAVHAEVDVEVGHGDPLGVQKKRSNSSE